MTTSLDGPQHPGRTWRYLGAIVPQSHRGHSPLTGSEAGSGASSLVSPLLCRGPDWPLQLPSTPICGEAPEFSGGSWLALTQIEQQWTLVRHLLQIKPAAPAMFHCSVKQLPLGPEFAGVSAAASDFNVKRVVNNTPCNNEECVNTQNRVGTSGVLASGAFWEQVLPGYLPCLNRAQGPHSQGGQCPGVEVNTTG